MNREWTHIIFLGDSLSRYQYLALMYRMHFLNRKVPNYMVHEGHHSSWTDFYSNTTMVFGGHMTCDCQRNDGPFVEATIKTVTENRFYRSVIRSPERPLLPHMFKASSIQVWGDHKIHGRVPPDMTSKAKVLKTDHEPFMWEYESIIQIVKYKCGCLEEHVVVLMQTIIGASSPAKSID